MTEGAGALGRYRAGGVSYDEALDVAGSPRPAWTATAAALAAVPLGELLDRRRQADRLLDAEGAGHLVHEAAGRASVPWRLDPIPFVLAEADHRLLAAALEQRARLLESALADLHGEQRLVRDGVVPAHLAPSLPVWRPPTGGSGASARRWLVHVALDVVRVADGTWAVVRHLTDAPVGAGYALIDRAVMARIVPGVLRAAGAVALSTHLDATRRALAAHAPADRPSPRTVVLTGGTSHPAFVEHSYLATQMGLHLAEPADLVVREQRLWLRVVGGVEPVDVVDRRIADADLDPLVGRGGGGVPALSWAAERGGVAVANGPGAALLEAEEFEPYLAAMARALLDEPLTLPPWRPGQQLATAPCLADDVTAGSVVLRLHGVIGSEGVDVMPGGIGRVLGPGDHPTGEGRRTAKDVWVVAAARRPAPVEVRAPQPQVDLGASLPTRAGEALYWLGRAVEQAEVQVRTTRTVSARLDEDPWATALGDGGWTSAVVALVRAARAEPWSTDSTAEGFAAGAAGLIAGELAATRAAAAHQVDVVLEEAAAVRPYLSTTTGRLLGRLAQTGPALLTGAGVEELELVLVDLAAFAGLAVESTVRGPAWRFLDLGRRLERCLAVLGAVEAAIGSAVEPLVFQPLAEVVLGSHESLVAYRRRYRSEVELRALLDLLVHDDANPRSVAFQLDRLREHAASLHWGLGSDLVAQASRGTFGHVGGSVTAGRRVDVDALVLATRAPLLVLADEVVRHWFADPVRPTAMGASVGTHTAATTRSSGRGRR